MSAKRSPHAECATAPVPERRRTQRTRLNGEVVLHFDDPDPIEVRGRLVDFSSEGFRAVHHHKALHTGQQVAFCHSIAQGSARVVWTRVLGDRVETGFLIL